MSYTCPSVQYNIHIQQILTLMHTHIVPAEPVTDLMVTAFNETSVSLSWMTGFDGFTPITGIEILVIPERGDPPATNPITLPPSNQAIISSLLPFREHEFSVAVRNLAGTSERRNVTANTLSLRKYYGGPFLNVDSYTIRLLSYVLSLSPSLVSKQNYLSHVFFSPPPPPRVGCPY